MSPLIIVASGLFLAVECAFSSFDNKTGGSSYTNSTNQSQRISFRDALSNEYPYRKYFKTEEDLMQAFENVRGYKLKLVPTNYAIINMPSANVNWMGGPPTIIECDPRDYRSTNWMSDWFNEQCRLQCRRYDEPVNSIDYWSKNKTIITQRVSKSGPLTNERLSDEVYKKITGCNNFRPGLMSGIIKYLRILNKSEINSVLDFSVGWGDRLIGAIAAGVRYVGVDPNPCVHVGYRAIVDKFAADNAAQYTLIESPFQTADLPLVLTESTESIELETYDLIFTSPPYFNLEIYSTDSTQSASEFSQLSDWFEDFLMTSLRKAWAVLNPLGYMVIIINNIRDKPDYVMKMIDKVGEFANVKYLGVLSYAEKRADDKRRFYYKSPQPMWIWRKTTTSEEVGGVDDFSNVVELNPKLVIVNTVNDNTTFTIVRDDMLPGGTKQRAMGIIKNIPNNEIVYAGPYNGFAQVAIAIGCKKYGKEATVFTTRDDYTTNIRAKKYGCNIIVYPNKTLKELQTIAASYAVSNGAYLLPFGFDFDEYREELTARLLEAVDGVIDRDFSNTIWVAGGSSTLLNVLYKIFPVAKFACVQISKTIWPDQIDQSRTKIYIAPEHFYNDAVLPPPYPSVIKYDAKVWQFARKHGKTGDLIWNVGAD